MLIFAFVLSRLRFGLYVLAVGANREAAVRAGIPVKRLTLEIYAIAGLMAGLAGFVSACHFLPDGIFGDRKRVSADRHSSHSSCRDRRDPTDRR